MNGKNDEMINNQITVFCDGGARGNPGPAASAFVVFNNQNETIYAQGFYLGVATNNQAEYQAVIEALSWVVKNKTTSQLKFNLDSQLVVNQLKGLYKINDANLKIKNSLIKKIILENSLSNINWNYVPRSQNYAADLLVNQTLDTHQ